MRFEELAPHGVRDQAVPEAVVHLHVLVEAVGPESPVVAPGIAGKEFVAARARECTLYEFACEWRVVVVRIRLAYSRILQVPRERRQTALHVARLQHGLVLLGPEGVGHCLRLLA